MYLGTCFVIVFICFQPKTSLEITMQHRHHQETSLSQMFKRSVDIGVSKALAFASLINSLTPIAVPHVPVLYKQYIITQLKIQAIDIYDILIKLREIVNWDTNALKQVGHAQVCF